MPSRLAPRSVLAVVGGAGAYLAIYAAFLGVFNIAVSAAAPTGYLTDIVISWILSTAVSGVAVSRILGARSFFHGCAAGALGAIVMIAGLRWLIGPMDHVGFMATFWVIASAALSGCGALIGRDRPIDPSSSAEL
jgi:hypothetical protein